ncbi:aldo/keto reductase [Cellulophaga lytica]|uniref:NADP-dependent oxidoreductase domain protein n=1 Tax=Cellulophaga lytica (strain ATCC 23178 / DSM 7489 / JCM 8516 / NBRC 14961 / NCIMB 1423 / VKM B-1433 / Cy l20) TaxID=867900 RepID=F0RDZ9_CELLC|nr:aldo/keto reductase [Cellulophaga lytica]ADY30954.1 NADP-dependent oxidoreductase domain protein [Cellulophaga lytica DSM 7489]WQG78132.1 aldo/keto reductase [Cellulophaga lytica]
MKNTKLGLGLAALGRPDYINIRTTNVNKSVAAFKENAFTMLDHAYELGIRYFDTAPSYGKGEQFLLDWKNQRGHKDLVLGTKWGYTYVANWEIGFNGKHEIKEHSLAKLKEQWQTSKNLLPELGIYQVHSATLESGILDNTNVLEELYTIKKETGLTIGISTSGTQQSNVIEKALGIKVNGEDLFTSFQVTYNVLEQSTYPILKQLLKENKTVIVKEFLANGRVFKSDAFKNYQKNYKTLEALANNHNVSVDAIALRFIIDALEPTYLLSGASNTVQLDSNYKALDIVLSKSDLEKLKQLKTNPNNYWEERSSLEWN